MSKTKNWTIKGGDVVLCTPFSFDRPKVTAPTKSEAIKMLLTRLKKMSQDSPAIYIKNGASLLAWHNGENVVTESGPIARTDKTSARWLSACISSADTMRNASADSSFTYYSSEEYQEANKAP